MADSPFMLRPAARAAPPGFPPDVAPNQIIYASHINAIRDSVAVWPGNVDGNGKNLSGVAAITATGAITGGSVSTGAITATTITTTGHVGFGVASGSAPLMIYSATNFPYSGLDGMISLLHPGSSFRHLNLGIDSAINRGYI